MNEVFDNEHMTGAKFTNVNLAGAVFVDVNLLDAAFTNINLSGAKFTDINFSKVTIEESCIDGLVIWGYDIYALIEAEKARQKAGGGS
jgi:uncharacterized protein YjbI with pentapeptide repeats